MTVKITQISTASGEIVLVIAYDNPKGSGTMFTYNLRKEDFYNALYQFLNIIGRALTLTDAQQVLVQIINKVRAGASSIPQNFDFTPYINAELES